MTIRLAQEMLNDVMKWQAVAKRKGWVVADDLEDVVCAICAHIDWLIEHENEPVLVAPLPIPKRLACEMEVSLETLKRIRGAQ